MDQHGNRRASADTAGSGSDVTAAYKKQKPKQKKELIVEFVTQHKSDEFTVETERQVLKLIKRTMQKAWNVNRNTHPPDVHFSSNELQL
jgi:RAB protein geranylgeranyltransferase component A